MASIYPRGNTHWIKYYPPGRSEPERQTLATPDPAMAQLMRRKLELEVALRQPELRGVTLPAKIWETLGESSLPAASPGAVVFSVAAVPAAAASAAPASPLIEEVLFEYVAFIRVENDGNHAVNKIGHLKKFFGAARLGVEGPEKGVFKGETLADVKVGNVRRLIDSLPVAKKTKKHHRETFHSLFEFAMKYNFFLPINFRYPNPMSALPGYHEKNKPIVYLKQTQIDDLLEKLAPHPSVRVAAALMIYGGLRRAEALWMTRSCLSPDLRFFSVVNKTDGEKDLESSLKTGERAVPIIPQLKAILEPYLAGLEGEWLVPSPTGMLWDGDNFGDKHRTLLRAAELDCTCLIYRHTFATARAREGWSLFRISKAMGNSIAVCERYYAAFIDPSVA